MNFDIQVVQVETVNKPAKNGNTYTQLEVTFKNLSSGRVEAKKLMSFSKPENVYKALLDAKQGAVFNITTEKNSNSGYWDWIDVTAKAPGSSSPTQEGLSTTSTKQLTTQTRSTYETPEERATKQVYIVKQSSLANAVALLAIGAKTSPSADTVLETAQKFTDWVLSTGRSAQEAKQTTQALLTQLADLPDDVPL